MTAGLVAEPKTQAVSSSAPLDPANFVPAAQSKPEVTLTFTAGAYGANWAFTAMRLF